MSFLLIFRANQAYARYWQGRTFTTHLFVEMRDMVMFCCLHTRGGQGKARWQWRSDSTTFTIAEKTHYDDEHDRLASVFLANVVRLSCALGVCFKMHSRVCSDGYCCGKIGPYAKWMTDWDRLRLRGLLRKDEWEQVTTALGILEPKEHMPRRRNDLSERASLLSKFDDEAEPPSDQDGQDFLVNLVPSMRPFVVILFHIKCEVYKYMNDSQYNEMPWALKERFVPTIAKHCSSIYFAYEMVNQSMMTPLPLPYVHLNKTLLCAFLMSFPCQLDFKLGWYANTVIPGLVALALLGIDSIATELENPFGDDTNDLDIIEQIHLLEHECMDILELCADGIARDNFEWKRAPDFIVDQSCKPSTEYLCLKYELPLIAWREQEEAKRWGPDFGTGDEPLAACVEGERVFVSE